MAVLSSHTLNGTDGTHAGGIPVVLEGPGGTVLFRTEMDEGGRLKQEIAPGQIDPQADYHLVFSMADYWAARGPRDRVQVMDQVVLRFRMPDPEGHYHMPVILSPNTYSVWWSS